MNQDVSDIKPFIGSLDFNVSQRFYIAMGWKLKFDDGHLAVLQLGDQRFYLQKYYQREWCENTMLHISVTDAQYWFEHATAVLDSASYGNARVSKPEEQSYGALVTFLWDPAGVLWHFAQSIRDGR